MHRFVGIYTTVIVYKDGFETVEGGSGTVCLGGLPGVNTGNRRDFSENL